MNELQKILDDAVDNLEAYHVETCLKAHNVGECDCGLTESIQQINYVITSFSNWYLSIIS